MAQAEVTPMVYREATSNCFSATLPSSVHLQSNFPTLVSLEVRNWNVLN
jgi:hypothetical protein